MANIYGKQLQLNWTSSWTGCDWTNGQPAASVTADQATAVHLNIV
jgi:hypothetical protein